MAVGVVRCAVGWLCASVWHVHQRRAVAHDSPNACALACHNGGRYHQTSAAIYLHHSHPHYPQHRKLDHATHISHLFIRVAIMVAFCRVLADRAKCREHCRTAQLVA